MQAWLSCTISATAEKYKLITESSPNNNMKRNLLNIDSWRISLTLKPRESVLVMILVVQLNKTWMEIFSLLLKGNLHTQWGPKAIFDLFII